MTFRSDVSALRLGTVVLGAIALTPVAFAQTAAPQATPSTIQNGRSDSLSGKLNASGGVIKPTQDVDPGMQKAAPVARTNSMPVIPPSATGGQNAK